MYSLVIVEDEFTMRRGLVNMVRWKELGFQVDGEFSDGRELMEYLKSNIPDVILTDIRMTSVSGLEIARFIFEEQLPIEVVLLSGHKEFSYAQEALEYHVFHYLLKPVNLTKLREVFRSLKETLDSRGRQENMLQDRLEHYSRLINYEKQQFVTDAYYGALRSAEQMDGRMRLILSGDAPGEDTNLFFVKVVLENDDTYKAFLSNYGEQELYEQMLHIMEYFDENLEYYPAAWSGCRENGFAMEGIFWEKRAENDREYQPQRLRQSIYSLMEIRAEVAVFRQLKIPDDLLNFADGIGQNEKEKTLVRDAEFLQYLQSQNKLLFSYLCQDRKEEGREIAKTLFQNYQRAGMSFAQRQCIYTVTKLLDEITDHDPVARDMLYEECMSSMPTLKMEELFKWFSNCMDTAFCYVEKQSDSKKDSSIEKVMDYLKQHYDEDITLNTIAEAVFLNPAYISRLIKEQTGRNYTELVMEIRIERAIELLERTDMFVYEVAEKVGYSNLKYFYKVFRKVKGKSPSDYRPGIK